MEILRSAQNDRQRKKSEHAVSLSTLSLFVLLEPAVCCNKQQAFFVSAFPSQAHFAGGYEVCLRVHAMLKRAFSEGSFKQFAKVRYIVKTKLLGNLIDWKGTVIQ